MSQTIAPHGGTLVNRLAPDSQRAGLQSQAKSLKQIRLPDRERCDVEMIAIGAFSPLTGFLGKADFDSVCDQARLANGTVWPVPITCSVDRRHRQWYRDRREGTALNDGQDRLLAILTVEEKYDHDKKKEVINVYKTDDTAHPGVAVVQNQGDVCLGGPIDVVTAKYDPEFPEFRLPPAETRKAFEAKGWKTVVAFQRNPIHRAHEYLTKCSLEVVNGLLIHPLVGETQAGDIPPDVRMDCYRVLIDRYYNKDLTMLTVMPGAMRYAGPREAILHSIIRKNYGCTHFIVGRDHAGVGDYYGTFDAQRIFDDFSPEEIGIVPLKFEHASWCKKCEGMVSTKTCPHGPEDKVFLSGKKVRVLLTEGKRPPEEFSRPEVAEILIADATKK